MFSSADAACSMVFIFNFMCTVRVLSHFRLEKIVTYPMTHAPWDIFPKGNIWLLVDQTDKQCYTPRRVYNLESLQNKSPGFGLVLSDLIKTLWSVSLKLK